MNRHVLVLVAGVCAPAAWLLVACSGTTASPDAEDASTGDDSSTAAMLDGAVAFDATALDAAISHADASADFGDAGVVDSCAAHDSGSLADGSTHPTPDASEEDASDAGAPFDCGAPPTFHPSTPDAGAYCPFSTATTPFATCAIGQHCCEPPAGTGTLSACESSCTGLVDGGIDWECQDSISCGLGESCCANVASVGAGLCTYPFLSGFTGTVCAQSCAAGQARICQSNLECLPGTVCVVTKANGASFGVCQ